MRNLLLFILMTMTGSVWAFKDCAECPEMLVIPAGSFLMGADPFSNQSLNPEESPQHRVQVQKFALGKYEITQEQWFLLMGNNPSVNRGRTLPVENVSWDEVQAFIEILSEKTGKVYRLPSETEWEYASRSGSSSQYYFGDSDKHLSDYAWYSANSGGKTRPVGLKKPNRFGLHDMLGNVWEWTQDCWNENYNGAPADETAWASGDCDARVIRSGSFYFKPSYLRTSSRNRDYTDIKNFNIGFRVARSP